MRPRTLLVLGLVATLATTGCLDAVTPSSADEPGNDTIEPQGRDDGSTNGTDDASDDEGGDSDEGNDDGTNSTSDDGDDANGTGDSSESGSSSDGSDDADGPTYPPWPEPAQASVRPGVQISSSSGQCTSNFLFRTPDNRTLMLGVAAHCVAANPDVGDGCDPATEPSEPGTEVDVGGATHPGVLVYSSWHTMQANNESDGDACRLNDFALIAIHPADRTAVHPALMHYGGPTGLAASSDVQAGDKVLWYGNSGTRAGIDQIQRNEGYVLRKDGARGFVMYTATPGVFGDSGSAVLTGDGQAAGVLSTIRLAPDAGSNGVALVEPALTYATQHGVDAELVTWELFDDGRLP